MTQFNSVDHQMMMHAIGLAARGRYTTSPNPNVGCVIVKNDTIIGQGFHRRAGEPHAEMRALVDAKQHNPDGSTVYVTLEPCSHYGQTPPCAEALIEANVSRVVCAMQDPNPKVSGRGIAMLREAGIQVDVGLLESEAMNLNTAFIKRMQTGLPWVQLKLGMSLDAKTALANGQSQWITSTHARQDVQARRAQADAILSTSKTVIDDNASLDVRWSELPTHIKPDLPIQMLRQPLKVILDRNNQLTTDLKLFNAKGEVLVINDEADIPLNATQDGFQLTHLLKWLVSEHNVNHVFVEAGATLAGALITEQLVDEVLIYMAPKLMGSDGRSLVEITGLTEMQQAIDLEFKEVTKIGPDLRLVCTVKNER